MSERRAVPDRWKMHTFNLAACRACCFWAEMDAGRVVGQCRRRAPVAIQELPYPITNAEHWCGDYAPRLPTGDATP